MSNIQKTYRVDIGKSELQTSLIASKPERYDESWKYDGEGLETCSFKEIYPFYTLFELF